MHIEGETKHVTVLFGELRGFGSLKGNLDAESSYAPVRRCLQVVLESVQRYDGMVCQSLGTGVLAVFGAPIAQEDHAQRAVRAALTIQRALTLVRHELRGQAANSLEFRVGLNSGPVIVDAIGLEPSLTYTAVGDTVSVAKWVSARGHGHVLITEVTRRLLGDAFIIREATQSTQGRVFEVVAPSRWHSRLDRYAERALTGFVGRDRDVDQVLARFAEVQAGTGQVVFVHGEPGIGKSRLLYECKRALEREPLTWLEGHCALETRETPYAPVVRMLKSQFEIQDTDPERETVSRIAAGLQAVAPQVQAILPYVNQLLGVPAGDPGVADMDPQMRKARLFEALGDLIAAAAAIRPLILALEDIHWIDRTSEELLSYLVDRLAQFRVLMLLSYRTGYDFRFGARPSFAHLELAPLSEAHGRSIVDQISGGVPVADTAHAQIYRTAEGNPFYTEEIARALAETGTLAQSGGPFGRAGDLRQFVVPQSVQDVIAARIDHLPEKQRRVIQIASVIGREFTPSLLKRVLAEADDLDNSLHVLKANELVYERSLYPELEYTFKHSLTHEVVYCSLSPGTRRRLHLEVAKAIEALHSDRLSDKFETLAFHAERAEDWDAAVDYLVKSGDKAMSAFAVAPAIGFYDRALAAAETAGRPLSPDRAVALHQSRGQALFVSDAWLESADSFKAMRSAAQEIGKQDLEGVALYQTAFAYVYAHRFEDALDFADRARRLALATGNQATLAGSRVAFATVCVCTGDLSNAERAAREGLQAAEEIGIPALQGRALYLLGLIDHWAGRYDRALESWNAVLRLGRQHELAALVRIALWTQGLVHCARGEYQHAIDCLNQQIGLALRLGDRHYRCRSLNTLGWVYMDLCNWQEAVRQNAQGVSESLVVGDPEIIRNAQLNLADCYLALGDIDAAQRELEAVRMECQKPGEWGDEWVKWRYSQHLNASLAELWLARGDTDKALHFANACLEAAQATNSPRNIVKSRRLRGDARLARGDLEASETELLEAIRVAQELGNPAQIWRSLETLGRLRLEQGRLSEAAQINAQALESIESVAAGLVDSTVRETFLCSPQVVRLREAARTANQSVAVSESHSQIEASATSNHPVSPERRQNAAFAAGSPPPAPVRRPRRRPLAPPGTPAALTGRELQVLRLVRNGYSNREIARELVLSNKTVGRHLENIFAKLGVSSRFAALAMVAEHDLIAPR
jgi:class 3 adenylate cyclase/DNA-binding CsgD family transcriptional regulator/tetratricopeptide (TPR) repeat protein